ncbi:MAG: class B sortase [Lachnospiraceae bacterium]|nr:class B sortase [Lachnospiraceae bacterium]
MEHAAKLARAGDCIVSFAAGILILLLLLYGGYSLWDTHMTYTAAFASSDLLAYKPVDDGVADENPTLGQLQEINPDVCAWLTIDDTHIDYPVVRGETDMEYVNKDVYGDFALSGAIFLSSSNEADFSDSYSIIYGHHMDNGAMFGDVVDFTGEEYFEAHQTGTLMLPEATYRIELFAVAEVDAYDTAVYNTSLYNAEETGDVSALLDYISGIAVQYREIGVTGEDQVVGFSTCQDAVTNGRVVLFGRLVRV